MHLVIRAHLRCPKIRGTGELKLEAEYSQELRCLWQHVCMNLRVSVSLFPFLSGTAWTPTHTCSVYLCLILPILLVLILVFSACNGCPGPKSTSWLCNSVPKAKLRLWMSSSLNPKRAERGYLLFSTQTPVLEGWQAITGLYVSHQSNVTLLGHGVTDASGPQLRQVTSKHSS